MAFLSGDDTPTSGCLAVMPGVKKAQKSQFGWKINGWQLWVGLFILCGSFYRHLLGVLPTYATAGGSNLYQKICTFNEGSIFKTLHRLSYWECYSWLIVVTKCCRKKPTVVICFDAAVKQKKTRWRQLIRHLMTQRSGRVSWKSFWAFFSEWPDLLKQKKNHFYWTAKHSPHIKRSWQKNDNLSFLVTVCASLISTFSGTRKWCISVTGNKCPSCKKLMNFLFQELNVQRCVSFLGN